MSEASIYEFGDVRVDTGRMLVTRADAVVELEPKAFDVLRFLIEHRERLVTKDELLDAVWQGTFVTPNVLTRAVAQIRKVIGDDAHESRYIETVAKRGYRFIASVVTRTAQPAVVSAGAVAVQDLSPPPAASLPAATRSIRQPLLIGAITLLVIGAAAGFFVASRGPTRQSATSATSFPSVRRLFGGNLGYYGEPTLSPDGHSIAYTSDKTGGLEIYVRGLVQGSREITITNDSGQNEQPQWSPDGLWIAYHSQVHGGVWIVPATGGVARQVVEFGSEPSWSPDSQWLAFASFEERSPRSR